MFKSKKQCIGCQAEKMCRDSVLSWIFLFIGVIATISIRMINLVLPFGAFWPKFFWYIGVAGFFLYFWYRFREDKILRAKLEKYQVHRKLSDNRPLEAAEKEFLSTLLCRMRSNKDAINYFFIFSSSAIVLILAIYQDFIKK
jgi:hypothetical protein